MTYVKQTWVDGDTTKPVSAARMQHIEDGLDAVANGGSISAVGDVTITSDSDGSGSGDIVFKTGSAPTERLRILASDGEVKFPSGAGIVNVAGSSSSLNIQINSSNILQFFNTSVSSNRSILMRNKWTTGTGSTQEAALYLQNNLDGGGDVTKWVVGLDVANSSQDDFTIARGVTPSGVHDVVYIKAYNSTASAVDVAIGLNATPPMHSSVHIGSTGTGNPILSIVRLNGQTADGVQYLHSDKSTLLWRVRFDGLADATVAGMGTKVKAGTPADSDWTSAPPDGTLVADSTGSKLWVRIGGAWKSVAVA